MDATRGDFFNVDYAVALRQLGGNISFNRLQATYRRYYKVNALRGTVFAGNATLGLANLFNPRDRDGNGTIDEIDLTLPISERFFSGGSTTLRGFNFEEAGPRQAIIPVGRFVDQNKETGDPESVHGAGRRQRARDRQSRSAHPGYESAAGGSVLRWRQRVPPRRRFVWQETTDTPVPPGDVLAAINAANLRAHWTNTVGLGFRIQTPFGGALAVDYGFLLNPPEFPDSAAWPKRHQTDFTARRQSIV